MNGPDPEKQALRLENERLKTTIAALGLDKSELEERLRKAVSVELRRHLCYTSGFSRKKFWQQVDERLEQDL